MLLAGVVVLLVSAVCGGHPLASDHLTDIVLTMTSLLRARRVVHIVDGSPEVATAARLLRVLAGSDVFSSGFRWHENIWHSIDCANSRPLVVVYSGGILKEFVGNLTQMPSRPRWLLFLLPLESANRALGHVDVPFDCELFVVSPPGAPAAALDVSEAYRVSAHAPLVTTHFGRWTPGGGLVATRESLYRRRTQLHGLEFTATAHHRPPFITMHQRHDGQFKVGGFYGNLWTILQQRLNLTTRFVLGPGDYGLRDARGAWSGMIGQLARGEAQVGVADFTITASRLDVVSYFTSVLSSSHRLFMRERRVLAVDWLSMTQPLSTRLWLAVLASCLLCSLVLAATARCVRPRLRVDDALFAVFGLFCQQGCETRVVGVSGRTAILTACVTALVTSAVYSSSLTSSLTDRKVALPFETLQGLVDHGHYKLAIMSESIFDIFRNATEPPFRRVYQEYFRHDGDRLPLYGWQSLHRICTEDFAGIASRKYKIEDKDELWRPCPLTWLPQKIMVDTISMIIAKDSPYRKLFDHQLRLLRDSGVTRQLRLRHWPLAAPPAAPEFAFVGLAQVAPMLLLLAAGVGVSLVVLGCELLVARSYGINAALVSK